MSLRRAFVLVAILLLALTNAARAQLEPKLGPNASAIGTFIMSSNCAATSQLSGANLCLDLTLNELFAFSSGSYSALVTGTNAAGGANFSFQYNLSNALAGLTGSGIPRLNTGSAPTIAVAGTDYQAPLTAGSPASTTIGGTGLSVPAAGFFYGQGASPVGLLTLLQDQVVAGPTTSPVALSLPNCLADGAHSYVYSTTTHIFSCVTVTASVVAPGTTGSVDWTNAGVLAGFSGTGPLKLNGTSSPSIAIAGTDFAAPTPGVTANLPLLTNGAGGFNTGLLSGSTTVEATVNGATPSNHIAKFDALNNIVDGGTLPTPTEINLCTLTGPQGGTAQFYEYVVGHDVKVMAYLSGYQNTSATAQTCSLTANGGTAYTVSAQIYSNSVPFPVVLSGTPPSSVSLPASMVANFPLTGIVVIDGS